MENQTNWVLDPTQSEITFKPDPIAIGFGIRILVQII
jgi:hypothetical protein